MYFPSLRRREPRPKKPRTRCHICLRITVAILGLVTFAVNGFVGGFIWWWWHRLVNPHSVEKPAGFLTGAFIFLAAVGLGGFGGAVFEVEWLEGVFEYTLFLVWLIALGLGTFGIVELFKVASYVIEECDIAVQIKADNAADKLALCTKYYDEGEAALISVFIILLAIGFFFVHLVRAYVKELEGKKHDWERLKNWVEGWFEKKRSKSTAEPRPRLSVEAPLTAGEEEKEIGAPRVIATEGETLEF